MTTARQIDHAAPKPQQGTRIGPALQPRDGRQRGERRPGLGQPPTSHLEGGGMAQGIEIVGIRITAGNRESAGIQDVGQFIG